MGQSWMIASGKGGVGKTAVTAALGAALAKRQLSCAVVDTDIGLRNLDLLLGLESKIVFDLLDVAQKECQLKQALVQDLQRPALALLPASQMGDPADLNGDALESVVQKLKKRFSYVLLDAPAGIGPGLQALLQSADHTLLVVTPDDVAIRDAERVVSLLAAQNKPRPMLIVNQVYPELVVNGEMYHPQTVADVLDVSLLGFIPHDLEVLRASIRHETFAGADCSAGRAIERICCRFVGESVPMPEFEKKRRFWRFIRNKKI